MYTYGWFMLRKQQNSVKQLSFNKKKMSLEGETVYVEIASGGITTL